MQHKHIAVFTPFATGHVYPALGVCSELVRRGYRVTYPTNEHFASRVRETGAEAVELEFLGFRYPKQLLQYPSSDSVDYWLATSSIYGPTFIAMATAAVAELEDFYEANPPDLILYEWFSFAGRILAKRIGCPAAQLHAHFAHRDWVIRVDGVCTTPAPMIAFSQLLDSFMAVFGIEGKNSLWHAENLNIILVPKSFQFDADSFDSRFKFVGVPLNRKPRSMIWKRNAQTRKPLLLISEASTTVDDSFLKVCINTFAESQYHVVFSKGSSSPAISSALLPHNFEVNMAAFNCEILPSSTAILCQGGMGTTLESLHHGVPVVAAPSSPFNSEVAYRMAELGLGVHLREKDLTFRQLRAAVDAASSDDAMRGRVRRMQENLMSHDPGESAANAIEEFHDAH